MHGVLDNNHSRSLIVCPQRQDMLSESNDAPVVRGLQWAITESCCPVRCASRLRPSQDRGCLEGDYNLSTARLSCDTCNVTCAGSCMKGKGERPPVTGTLGFPRPSSSWNCEGVCQDVWGNPSSTHEVFRVVVCVDAHCRSPLKTIVLP